MTARNRLLVKSQRRQIKAYIEADEQLISFRRPLSGITPDGAGGHNVTANLVTVAPQKCRIIPSRTRSANQVTVSVIGQIVSTRDATLVGYHDLDVSLNDFLTWEDQDFQVTFIYSDRRWMTVVQLDLMGETYRSSI